MAVFKYFITIIMIQLFYSFGVVLLANTLAPFDTSEYLLPQYTNLTSDIQTISSRVEGTVQTQMNIPLLDLGALVFYSGNILIDLMLNFFFAIPSMFSILVNTFTSIFVIDSFIATQLKLFMYGIITILYFFSILNLILSIRARGSII